MDQVTAWNTYKVHLPAGIPASLFWAVPAYNVTDGTMPETDYLMDPCIERKRSDGLRITQGDS